MEPNQELLTYIKARRDQGAVFPDIENELKGVGWNQIDIDVAIKTLEVSIVPVQESVPEKKEEAAEEPVVDATPMVPEIPSQVAEPVEELKKTVKTHEAALILILITVIVAVVGFSLWWYLTHRTPVELTVSMGNVATTTLVENMNTKNASTTVIVENATSTKKELPKDYEIKADGVYYKGKMLRGSNPATFQYIGDGYSKDKTSIYYEDQWDGDFDTANFQLLGGGYAKDKFNAYYKGMIMDMGKIDPLTFQYVSDDYSKDKMSVYLYGEKVVGAKPSDCTKQNLRGCVGTR